MNHRVKTCAAIAFLALALLPGAALGAGEIANPGFESGPFIGWDEFTLTPEYFVVMDADDLLVPPHGGAWAAWLGGEEPPTKQVVSYIVQQVLVPEGYPSLSFWYWTASIDVCNFDFGRVLINDSIIKSYPLCTGTNTDSWVQARVPLQSYAGQTVRLRFEVWADDTNNSNWFIDDVAFAGGVSYVYLPGVINGP